MGLHPKIMFKQTKRLLKLRRVVESSPSLLLGSLELNI